MSKRSLVATVLVSVLLGLLAIYQLAIGGNALPTWITSVAVRQDHDLLTYLRVLIAIEILVALVLIGLGRAGIPLAWITLVGIAFIGLAECSAALQNKQYEIMVFAALLVACAAVLAILLGRASPEQISKKDETSSPGSLRWIALVFLILAGAAIAMNMPLAPRTLAEGRALVNEDPTRSGDSPVIDFNPDQWLGKPISDIKLTTFVPELNRLTEKGRSLVVIYNLGCGDCHELFEAHFADGFEIPVIAIEVPPAENTIMSPSARTDPVTCLDCTMTSLPPGPLWLVNTPTIMLVEEGTITCVEVVEPTRCINEV